ncbi:MAG: MerR family transcriptional regulator [Myxococcales bacterium]|nr:MerR family transcriptional regulator [Myxococcota bacterium]MDW8283835.1 MerR family transcriptional regulator [Myxococcales bacterium]
MSSVPLRKPGTRGNKADEAPHLTLKDMVRGAGTTARAVRFYEEQGLIRTVGRSPGGHRLFAVEELGKLRLILELRTCGFSIEEIREILEAKGRCGTVREAALVIQGLLARHVEELRRKIATIERLGREFCTSISLLDRCLHCTDPRGAGACTTCDLPRSPETPHSFCQIWAVLPPPKGGGPST